MSVPVDHVILLQSIYSKEAIEMHINMIYKNIKNKNFPGGPVVGNLLPLKGSSIH